MFSKTWLRSLLIALMLPLALAPAAAAQAAPGRPDPIERFRRQLAAYFADLHESSPTVLGAQAPGQDARDAMQRRIAAMSRAELEELSKGFSQVPNWQIAPEALASALPAPTRQQLTAAGARYAAKAGEAAAFRDDVARVATFAKLLPEATLKKMRLDPSAVAAVEEGFSAMSPLQAAMLEERLPAGNTLRAQSAAVLAALPAPLRQGVDALAQHGPLAEEEKAALGRFAQAVGTLVAEMRGLPPDVRRSFDAAKVDGLARRLAGASPEVLFMIREQVGEEEVRQALATVRQVKRFAALTEAERQELEALRAELREALAAAGTPPAPDSALAAFDRRLAGLTPPQLFGLHERLAGAPAWREVYPAMVAALASPELTAQVAALRGASPDAQAVAELESFRGKALAFLEQRAAGADAQRLAPSLERLRRAGPPELAVLRAVAARLPEQANAAALASLVPLAEALELNCTVDLGVKVSFDFICDPIEDIFEFVETIVAVVGRIFTLADDIMGYLEEALTGVVDNVLHVFFEHLLEVSICVGPNGSAPCYTLADLKDPASLKTALLDGFSSLPSSLPILPDVPCPADGTPIPLFGNVGEADTAAKYTRYKWLFDKLLEIIPDTELSMPAQITAQLLYGGVEYLEICLEEAAAARDSQETADFRSGVSSSLSTSLANDTTILASIAGVSGKIDAQGNTLIHLIESQGAALSNLVRQEADELTDQIDTFQQLDLRLAVEANLLAAEGSEIAKFQLPEPWGYLDLAEEIVRDTIDSFLAAGQAVNALAQKELAAGAADLTAGFYKTAYGHFQKAYRAAVKK